MVPVREEQAQALFRSWLERGQIATRDEYERIRNRPLPEAIAPFVTYLATEEDGYITGELFLCEAVGSPSIPNLSRGRRLSRKAKTTTNSGPWMS